MVRVQMGADHLKMEELEALLLDQALMEEAAALVAEVAVRTIIWVVVAVEVVSAEVKVVPSLA